MHSFLIYIKDQKNMKHWICIFKIWFLHIFIYTRHLMINEKQTIACDIKTNHCHQWKSWIQNEKTYYFNQRPELQAFKLHNDMKIKPKNPTQGCKSFNYDATEQKDWPGADFGSASNESTFLFGK